MSQNMVDNKTYNLNFSVTFNLSNKNGEHCSSSKNCAKLRSRVFSKKSIVVDKIQERKVTRKKLILEELPNSSETDDMRKIR